MTVVIVGGNLPYPPTAGNRIRTLNLLTRLARRHRIIFLAHKNPDPVEEASAIAHLREQGIEAVTLEHRVPSKKGPLFLARLGLNVFSPLPYSIASHVGSTFVEGVRDLARREKVDLWQAEGLPYFEALRGLTEARTVIMAHNVESLIWRRYYETESNLLRRWYIGLQWRKFERYESRAFREATRVVAVSDDDARLARDRFGVDRIDVVDNGIDRGYFGSVHRDPEPGRILFLGSLEWRPNLDALTVLLDRIFPALKREVPDVKLSIVGRNPPESLVRRAAATPDVELHANVPDVRPFLARSALMAVPLRIGGGSRLKILEALAAGLPVVSTRVGAEGLKLEPGVQIDIADDESEFVAKLSSALRDPSRAEVQAEAGRRKVLEEYDWDALATRLEQSWERSFHG